MRQTSEKWLPREGLANDTSLTFPSPEVTYTFPSEDSFSAATKLLGLLEKRQLNLCIFLAALYHHMCTWYFEKRLEMSWNPREDYTIILLYKVLPNCLPNVWGYFTHSEITSFSEGHFIKYMACKASPTPRGKGRMLPHMFGEGLFMYSFNKVIWSSCYVWATT